eukprot:TRINITY_DN3337_c0_g1_i1.p1 TRINITY_DN3337_c0_g1~~TRINITY_DN3337_c0_g1_i1.p1  ORF type:complete len:349 (+),score=114.03 TRINITY_DN3337_c0_g1_i1:161-1207(+)
MLHTFVSSSSSSLLSGASRLSCSKVPQRFFAAAQSVVQTHMPFTPPKHVKIVEVGPRDGLQNERKVVIPTHIKLELIRRLGSTGLRTIETTSFVSKTRIPQMADAAEVMKGLDPIPGVSYPVLVPTINYYHQAIEAGVKEIAIFTSASEGFCKANIGCTVEESFQRFVPIMERAKAYGISVRGYVSCVSECPLTGPVDPVDVARASSKLLDIGCYEVSLGDTIGTGTPESISRMLKEVMKFVPAEKLAGHFHDTYGMAVANILIAMQMGVSVFDSSVAGLGGCPYAKGATGNVATEEVVYMLTGMGVETGIDLDMLIDVGEYISGFLGRPPASRVARAILNKRSSNIS